MFAISDVISAENEGNKNECLIVLTAHGVWKEFPVRHCVPELNRSFSFEGFHSLLQTVFHNSKNSQV